MYICNVLTNLIKPVFIKYFGKRNYTSNFILRLFLLMFCTIFIGAKNNSTTTTVGEDKVSEFTSVTVSSGVSNPQVYIHLSQPVKWTTFRIDQPSQIVINLNNTVHNWKEKRITVKNPVITGVRTAQFQVQPSKVTRVVIDTSKPVLYEIQNKDNSLIVNIGSGIVPDVNVSTTTEHVTETDAKVKSVPSVNKGSGKVDKPEPVKKTEPESVKIESTQSSVSQTNKNNGKRTAVAEENPVLKETKDDRTSGELFGSQPVSLNFFEADIRDVLRMVQVQSGLNLIYGDEVKGTVNIKLDNVPMDEAIRTILSLKGLVAQPVGKNIVRITTPEILTGERALAVTYTKIVPLSYAKAGMVKEQLDNIRAAEQRKGIIGIDERTNSLVITDTMEGLEIAQKIIKQLDVKPLQVLIEGKIVEVTLNSVLDLGIIWNLDLKTDNLNVTGAGNLPGAGGGSEIAFGIINNTLKLLSKISALATEGKTRILSSPKIVTLNNESAQIVVGQKVPYKVTTLSPSGSSVESTEFVQVGVMMQVLPTINFDRTVSMKVTPEVSLVTAYRADRPVIAIRTAQTTVLLRDRETLVIGGLISEQQLLSASKVPLLAELPILGQFFKRNADSNDRTELLVFFTPTIFE